MYALEPQIVARLAQALPDAQVVGWSEDVSRKVPANKVLLVVSLDDTPVNTSNQKAASIGAAWSVALAARRGSGSVDLLDGAFDASFQALHDWAPEPVRGRPWDYLHYRRASPMPEQDDGVFGVVMYFETAAIYRSGN